MSKHERTTRNDYQQEMRPRPGRDAQTLPRLNHRVDDVPQRARRIAQARARSLPTSPAHPTSCGRPDRRTALITSPAAYRAAMRAVVFGPGGRRRAGRSTVRLQLEQNRRSLITDAGAQLFVRPTDLARRRAGPARCRSSGPVDILVQNAGTCPHRVHASGSTFRTGSHHRDRVNLVRGRPTLRAASSMIDVWLGAGS